MHTASGRDCRLCDSGEAENSHFVLSVLQLRLVLLKKKKGAKLIFLKIERGPNWVTVTFLWAAPLSQKISSPEEALNWWHEIWPCSFSHALWNPWYCENFKFFIAIGDCLHEKIHWCFLEIRKQYCLKQVKVFTTSNDVTLQFILLHLVNSQFMLPHFRCIEINSCGKSWGTESSFFGGK